MSSESGVTPWSYVAIAVGVGAISAFYIGKAPPALPEMRVELGMSLVTAGWIVSIFNFLGLIVGIGAGFLADRFGPAKLISISVLVMAVGSIIGSLADSTLLIMVSRALEGAGYAAILVGSPALIAEISQPKSRQAAVSLWSSATPSGITLGVVVAPLILEPFGWRGLWMATALLSIAAFVIFQFFVTRNLAPRPPKVRNFWGDVHSTAARPGPWLLAVCFMTYTFQWMVVVVWLPTFLVEEKASGLGLAAVLTALVIAINIPGNFLGSWLIHRGTPRWLMITTGTTIMGVTSSLIFPEALPDGVRYLLVLVFSFFGGLQPASLVSGPTVHAPSPDQIGTTGGFMYVGSNAGQLIGPPIIAFVVTTTGIWAPAGNVLLALSGINILAAIYIRSLENKINPPF